MKGLRRVLTPFAPDQSGAVSVLYGYGGLLVILDAGGCAGNICGFDEPRWHDIRSAVFSAGLRDMDAILGRDDLLVKKTAAAAERIDANFIGIIGTPVPAVIGTDFPALRRMLERKTGLPVISLAETGMQLADRGASDAFSALFAVLAEDQTEPCSGQIGVLGMTPLDFACTAGEMRTALRRYGIADCVIYGMDADLGAVRRAGACEKNIVVSPSGLRAARELQERFGTPYEVWCPVEALGVGEIPKGVERALVIHQQIAANAIRDEIRRINPGAAVTAATWFSLHPELQEAGDVHLQEEEELESLAGNGAFDIVAADPVMRELLPDGAALIPAPHFAVSGTR